jgi:hypothetical protein
MKRAVIGSFGVSMFLGAMYLGALAFSNLRVRCEDGGHPECAFIEETAHENGRMQALGAAGCALVGSGLLLFLRSQAKEA